MSPKENRDDIGSVLVSCAVEVYVHESANSDGELRVRAHIPNCAPRFARTDSVSHCALYRWMARLTTSLASPFIEERRAFDGRAVQTRTIAWKSHRR